jgi:hypothetical protein
MGWIIPTSFKNLFLPYFFESFTKIQSYTKDDTGNGSRLSNRFGFYLTYTYK